MDWLFEAAVIGGMFILRLGVPLAITLAAGYLLRRLDARWQAEAWAQWEASRGEDEPAPDFSAFEEATEPCWAIKRCNGPVVEDCPTVARPDVPCWLARLQAEGQLPAACYNCELFAFNEKAYYWLN